MLQNSYFLTNIILIKIISSSGCNTAGSCCLGWLQCQQEPYSLLQSITCLIFSFFVQNEQVLSAQWAVFSVPIIASETQACISVWEAVSYGYCGWYSLFIYSQCFPLEFKRSKQKKHRCIFFPTERLCCGVCCGFGVFFSSFFPPKYYCCCSGSSHLLVSRGRVWEHRQTYVCCSLCNFICSNPFIHCLH